MDTQYLVDIPNVDACKIALLVKSASSGGFTTDSGSWAEIATRGKSLADTCLLATQGKGRVGWGGGVGNAGTHGRLNIVVYSWRSAFDRAITSGIRSDGLVGVDWNETRASSGETGNLTAAYNAIRNLSDGQIRQVAHDFDRGLVSK